MAETFDLGGRLVSVSDANDVTTDGRAPTVQERRASLVLSAFVRRGTHEVVKEVVVERPIELWPTRPVAVPDPVKRARVLAERAAARAIKPAAMKVTRGNG
jgi:hypothetical protein